MTGDGEVDLTGEVITYEFDESGEYEVTLTVVDNEDNEDSGQEVVRVDPAPLEPELRSSVLDFESVLVPHGHIRIDFILENMDTNDISEPSINLDIPDGWQISDRDDRDGTWVDSDTRWEYDDLPPDEAAQAEVEVGVPADSEEGEYTISATATSQTETLDTTSVTVSIIDRFHPTVHGFGFSNYDITSVHGPGDNFDRTAIKESLEADWDSSYITDLCSDNTPKSVVELKLSLLINIASYLISRPLGSLSLYVVGHCYGMAAVSKQYYKNPTTIPVGNVETSADLIDPTQLDVHTEIDTAHRDQLMDFGNFLCLLMLITGVGYDLKQEVDRIKEQFNPADPSLLGVNALGNHVVLLYDISEYEPATGGTGTTFHLYDNNFAADAAQVDTRDFKVIQKDGQVTVDDPLITRTSKGFNYPMDKIALLTDPPVLDDCKELLDGILTFEVFSPALLEVRDPDDDPLYPLDQDRAPIASEFRFDIAAESGDYRIDVIGTDSGEFTLEVDGVAWDGTLIDEQVTGTIDEGEVHSFVATVPESVDEEGTLEQISDDPDDDEPEWLPYAGAGAGAAGIGALLYQYLKGDDSPTDASDAGRHKQESETTSDNE